MSSSLIHPGMAFPQGEEEEEEDVGMMPEGVWTPQSATCKRRWEAGKCHREKCRESSLLLIWLFWQSARCPVRLTARGLARFAHP